MAAGPAGVHGVLVLLLVVTDDRSACVSVTIQCQSMVVNSARDLRENSTIARKTTAQVTLFNFSFIRGDLETRDKISCG